MSSTQQQRWEEARNHVVEMLKSLQALSSPESKEALQLVQECLTDGESVTPRQPSRKRKRTSDASAEEEECIEPEIESTKLSAYLDSLPIEPPYVLHDWQVPHHERENAILDKWGLVLDRTKQGVGKTPATILLAASRKVDGILTVHPAGALSLTWRKGARRQGLKVIGDMSWHGLTGNKRYDPSHQWLKRIETEEHYQGKDGLPLTRIVVTYEPTQKLIDLVNKYKIAVILDEPQNATNGGDRTRAAAAAVRAVLPCGLGKRTNESVVVLTSGTMINVPEHIAPILKILQLLPERFGDRAHAGATTDKQGNINLRHDLVRLCQFCREVEGEKGQTDRLYSKWIEKRCTISEAKMSLSTRIDHFIYELWVAVLQPVLSSTMVNPNPLYRTVVSDVFYRFDNEADQKEYNEAVLEREKAGTAWLGHKQNAFAMVTESHHRVHLASVPLLVKAVRHHHAANPKCKINIGVHHTDVLEALMEQLADQKPMKFSGDPHLSDVEKDKLCARFRAHEHDPVTGELLDRLLIANAPCIGEGNSLHDDTGEYPVISIGLSSFDGRGNAQWIMRPAREGSIGDINVEWVYGSSGKADEREFVRSGQLSHENKQLRIMRSLIRKTTYQKGTWGETDPAMFADNYPCKLQLADGQIVEVKPLQIVQLPPPDVNWTAPPPISAVRPKLIQQTIPVKAKAASDENEQKKKKARLVYEQTKQRRLSPTSAAAAASPSSEADVIMIDSD